MATELIFNFVLFFVILDTYSAMYIAGKVSYDLFYFLFFYFLITKLFLSDKKKYTYFSFSIFRIFDFSLCKHIRVKSQNINAKTRKAIIPNY
jgi:hypothetical protein